MLFRKSEKLHAVNSRQKKKSITYNIFRTLLIGRCEKPVKTKEKALHLVDGIVFTKQLTI